MIGLALAALFIALNGFFVAAEFALVKVRATQLGPRARRGERSAIIAQQIGARLDRYLSTTQLGITLASLGLGWIGEPALAGWLRAPLSLLPLQPHGLEIATIAVAFGALTFLHVLLGELVPKLVAIQRTEQTALFSALPLRVMYLTFQPALFVLERASRLVLTAMGLKADVTSEGTLSEEEIIGILAASTSRSPQGREKSQLVERVLRFSQRTARHVMIPRVDIASLPITTSVPDAVEQFRQHGYSRLLVTRAAESSAGDTRRGLDDVAGYLYVKDLLDRSAASAPDVSGITRDVLFVPERRNLVEVMRDMQRTGVPIGVVVDEYGGTSGLVTLEDLLEEIVGEIRDELDEEPPRVSRRGESWEVDGRATMEEVSKATGVPLEDGPEQIGVVVLRRIARLARVGDRVELAPEATAEVTGLYRRRITKLKITTR